MALTKSIPAVRSSSEKKIFKYTEHAKVDVVIVSSIRQTKLYCTKGAGGAA